MKRLAEQWRSLSAEQRAPFEAAAAAERADVGSAAAAVAHA